jgi:fucose permease
MTVEVAADVKSTLNDGSLTPPSSKAYGSKVVPLAGVGNAAVPPMTSLILHH